MRKDPERMALLMWISAESESAMMYVAMPVVGKPALRKWVLTEELDNYGTIHSDSKCASSGKVSTLRYVLAGVNVRLCRYKTVVMKYPVLRMSQNKAFGLSLLYRPYIYHHQRRSIIPCCVCLDSLQWNLPGYRKKYKDNEHPPNVTSTSLPRNTEMDVPKLEAATLGRKRLSLKENLQEAVRFLEEDVGAKSCDRPDLHPIDTID